AGGCARSSERRILASRENRIAKVEKNPSTKRNGGSTTTCRKGSHSASCTCFSKLSTPNSCFQYVGRSADLPRFASLSEFHDAANSASWYCGGTSSQAAMYAASSGTRT